MNIDDGQVAAFSGEMLAEGTFTFRGKGSEGLQSAASGKVGVRPGRGGRGTAFTLYANPVRDSDGLWSAGRRHRRRRMVPNVCGDTSGIPHVGRGRPHGFAARHAASRAAGATRVLA